MKTFTKVLAVPAIHLNGTGKETLQNELHTAWTAVDSAFAALQYMTTHSRDYYVQPDYETAWIKAQNQQLDRIFALENVKTELQEIYLAIDRNETETTASLGRKKSMSKRDKFRRIKKLLNRLRDIQTNPYHEFRMQTYLVALDETLRGECVAVRKIRDNGPACRTAGCLAGEAVILFEPDEKTKLPLTGNLNTGFYFNRGMKYLGLTREEARYMFCGEWTATPRFDITIEEAIGYLEKILREKDIKVVVRPETRTVYV